MANTTTETAVTTLGTVKAAIAEVNALGKGYLRETARAINARGRLEAAFDALCVAVAALNGTLEETAASLSSDDGVFIPVSGGWKRTNSVDKNVVARLRDCALIAEAAGCAPYEAYREVGYTNSTRNGLNYEAHLAAVRSLVTSEREAKAADPSAKRLTGSQVVAKAAANVKMAHKGLTNVDKQISDVINALGRISDPLSEAQYASLMRAVKAHAPD